MWLIRPKVLHSLMEYKKIKKNKKKGIRLTIVSWAGNPGQEQGKSSSKGEASFASDCISREISIWAKTVEHWLLD